MKDAGKLARRLPRGEGSRVPPGHGGKQAA